MVRHRSWKEVPRNHLQEIIEHGDSERREAARREQRRREQQRRTFVRKFDDEELREITTAGPHVKLGRFLGRATDEGIHMKRAGLIELAERELERREQARERAKQAAEQLREPFRVV